MGALVGISLVVLFADLQIASVTTRYFNDFGWMLITAALLVIWTAQESARGHGWLPPFVALLSCGGVALNLLALFSAGRYAPMCSTCPSLYHLVESWLSVY